MCLGVIWKFGEVLCRKDSSSAVSWGQYLGRGGTVKEEE